MRGAELALDKVVPLVTVDGGEGVWLTLQARGQNVDRAQDETDASVRERMRTVEDAVSRPAITEAVQAVLDENGVVGSAFLIEWWEEPYLDLEESVAPGGLYLDSTRWSGGPRRFLVLIPASVDDTVRAAIVAEVERLRAAGTGWRLVWSST